MKHVFDTMGTVASVDIRGSASSNPNALDALFGSIESTFSLYLPDSELSRMAEGSLRLTDASCDVLTVYAEALEWRRLTDGAFTPHRPDGVVDLDGIVKAIAIERGGALLDSLGNADWCLNVGGDILISGPSEARGPWIFGIVDPIDRSAMLCSVELGATRRALATSGTSERGEHIWRRPEIVSDLIQVSVVADAIITADVLATAILAGGKAFLEVATERWSIDVCAVARDGSIAMTPGLRNSLASTS